MNKKKKTTTTAYSSTAESALTHAIAPSQSHKHEHVQTHKHARTHRYNLYEGGPR